MVRSRPASPRDRDRSRHHPRWPVCGGSCRRLCGTLSATPPVHHVPSSGWCGLRILVRQSASLRSLPSRLPKAQSSFRSRGTSRPIHAARVARPQVSTHRSSATRSRLASRRSVLCARRCLPSIPAMSLCLARGPLSPCPEHRILSGRRRYPRQASRCARSSALSPRLRATCPSLMSSWRPPRLGGSPIPRLAGFGRVVLSAGHVEGPSLSHRLGPSVDSNERTQKKWSSLPLVRADRSCSRSRSNGSRRLARK